MTELDEWIKALADMNVVIQHQLQRAQQRMKAQADEGRVERQFSVGDSVYLKLLSYVQMTTTRCSNQKLLFKYFGPSPILQKAGAVAYKFQLPETRKIHPVVHVALLKKAVPPASEVCSDLPDDCANSDQVVQSEAVLDRRVINHSEGTTA